MYFNDVIENVNFKWLPARFYQTIYDKYTQWRLIAGMFKNIINTLKCENQKYLRQQNNNYSEHIK